MISVEEAKRIMMSQVKSLTTERIPLTTATHRFVMEDLFAPFDHPLFDMSAVDGYALGSGTVGMEWTVVGEVAAGEVFPRSLASGECVRIFTGAALPEGADTIVMQEFVTRSGERITHGDHRLAKGGNVRKRAEQMRAGSPLLPGGAAFRPEVCGLLATFGIERVDAAVRPEVAVLITGSEFIKGDAPSAGKIHGSNDVMLASALERIDTNWWTRQVPDEFGRLREALVEATSAADLVITTGGASVGDHDLIEPVLADLGAAIHFHNVAQKPGKPMLFATLNGKPIFALPGNPRAVMVLFWEFVLPFLRAMQGAKDPWLKNDKLPLTHALNVKGDRAEFRAALVKDGQVTLPPDEGSHMLRSLVEADALAYLPASKRMWAQGDPVEIHYIPG